MRTSLILALLVFLLVGQSCTTSPSYTYDEALEIYNSNRPDSVISYVETAIKSNDAGSDYSRLAYLAGYVLSNQGEYKKAITYFGYAFNHEPDQDLMHRILMSMGHCYHQLSDFDRSLEAYEKARRLNDTDMVNYSLGVVYRDSGEPSKAQDHFSKALVSFKASNNDQMTCWTYNEIGILLYNIESYQKAREYYELKYEHAQKIKCGHETFALNNIGNTYYKEGQFDLAVTYMTRAYESASNEHDQIHSLRRMADIHEQEGRISEAISLYRELSIKFDNPKDQEEYYHALTQLITLYASQNMPDSSKHYSQLLKSTVKDFSVVSQAEKTTVEEKVATLEDQLILQNQTNFLKQTGIIAFAIVFLVVLSFYAAKKFLTKVATDRQKEILAEHNKDLKSIIEQYKQTTDQMSSLLPGRQ